MSGKEFRGPNNCWLLGVIVMLWLAACEKSTAPVGVPASSASTAWPTLTTDKAPVVVEFEIVPISDHDPEYWAVLHIVQSQHLIMLLADHDMTKAALDCEAGKLKQLGRWSRTLPNAKLLSAWANWINYSMNRVQESRIAPESVVQDPDKMTKEKAMEAGEAMSQTIDVPTIQDCDPP